MPEPILAARHDGVFAVLGLRRFGVSAAEPGEIVALAHPSGERAAWVAAG